MSSYSGASLKPQSIVQQTESIRARIRPTSSTAEKSTITENPIYQIMFDTSKSPNERRAEFAKFMTATLDKERDRENIKAFEEFREFLSHQNTALAQKIIELTNTKTFASLQKIIEDMSSGLMNFEDDLKPLMDTVDAVFQLRSSGVIYDAFREIENDRVADEQNKLELARLESENILKQQQLNDLRVTNAQLAQQRGMFGFGGITEEARSQIATNEVLEKAIADDLAKITADLDSRKNNVVVRESNLGEMAIHKEKLRELLDLSSEENIGRMAKLRDSALSFIENSKVSTTTIRGEFGNLSEQLNDAEDNNRKMTTIYAIVNEGMKDASLVNIAKRAELDTTLTATDDNLIIKMETEDKIRNLDSHSKMLHAAQGETLNTYAELHQQAIRVGAMKESTIQQVDVARKLNTQGVSATADQLASVMTAISGAAIRESAGVVEQTLDRMRVKNNEITQQEVIRNAHNVDKINDEMEKVFSELQQFRDTQNISATIVREGVQVMNENMDALFAQTQQLKEEMKESLAINSKLAYTGLEEKVSEVTKVKVEQPFK